MLIANVSDNVCSAEVSAEENEECWSWKTEMSNASELYRQSTVVVWKRAVDPNLGQVEIVVCRDVFP